MKNIINLVLMTVVGIILLGSFMVPVIDDSTTLQEKELHKNTGTYYFESMDTATIELTLGTENWAVEVNGNAVEVGDYGVIVMSDTVAISTGNLGEIFAFDPTNNKFIAGGAEQGTATITIGSGSYTVSVGDNDITGTTSNVIIASDSTNGDYILATAGTVNKESKGLAYAGVILWGAEQGNVVINDFTTGTVDYSLKTITDFAVTNSTDADYVWEVVNNKNGSYDVSAFADSDDSTLNTLTFIPVSYYTMEDTEGLTILKVIPVIIIVAILMAAVSGVLLTKKD